MYQTTRGDIMERGVAMEAGISGILGLILNIDVQQSKSLGHQNSSLSLNAKVNLLTDLKFVPKEIARQFQLFAEIRNKFAHVADVDSFTKCFDFIPDQKNYFVTTFVQGKKDVTEDDLKSGFFLLCLTLSLWMKLILEKDKSAKIKELKKTTVIEMLREFFKSAEEDIEGKDDPFFAQLDSLINEIDEDKDFIKSIAEAIEINEKISEKNEAK